MRRHCAGGDGAMGVGYLVRVKSDLEVTDGRDTKQTFKRANSEECDLRLRREERRPTRSFP
jgi:hypothetical protein